MNNGLLQPRAKNPALKHGSQSSPTRTCGSVIGPV